MLNKTLDITVIILTYNEELTNLIYYYIEYE